MTFQLSMIKRVQSRKVRSLILCVHEALCRINTVVEVYIGIWTSTAKPEVRKLPHTSTLLELAHLTSF